MKPWNIEKQYHNNELEVSRQFREARIIDVLGIPFRGSTIRPQPFDNILGPLELH